MTEIAHWKLNDDLATDVVIDETGGSNGTLVDPGGTATTAFHTTTGKIDAALTFDGTDDYIDTNTTFQSTFKGSFTISMWVKPDDGKPPNVEILFGSDKGANDTISLTLMHAANGGKLEVTYEANGVQAVARTFLAVFENGAAADYVHIVVVCDETVGGPNGIIIYVDTVDRPLSASQDGNTAGITFADFVTDENLYLGALNDDGAMSDPYTGDIDNVIIFNTALSASQVAQLYRDGTVPFFRSRYSGNSAFRLLRRRFSPNSSF